MIKKITATFLFLTIAFISFSKNKIVKVLEDSNPLIGMVLLKDNNSLSMDNFVADIENKWKLKIDSKEIGEASCVLKIEDYVVILGVIKAQVPGNEVEETAEYNYLWPNAAKITSKHTGHIIVSISNAGTNPVKENILYNKVTAAVLENSDAIGLYMGGRSLLLQKDFYLENTKTMSRQDLPLYNWIYFGLKEENGKQSIYTYGLKDFGKSEMEIVNSTHNHMELIDMMYNLSHYVIGSNVTLHDGETIGMSADQKLKIKESKGKYLEGKTLKISY